MANYLNKVRFLDEEGNVSSEEDFNLGVGSLKPSLGEDSLAGGENSTAQKKNSFLYGEGLRDTAKDSVEGDAGQLIFGRYNKIDDDAIFLIGDGSNDQVRSNLLRLSKDGKLYIKDKQIATLKDVETEESFLESAEYDNETKDLVLVVYQGSGKEKKEIRIPVTDFATDAEDIFFNFPLSEDGKLRLTEDFGKYKVDKNKGYASIPVNENTSLQTLFLDAFREEKSVGELNGPTFGYSFRALKNGQIYEVGEKFNLNGDSINNTLTQVKYPYGGENNAKESDFVFNSSDVVIKNTSNEKIELSLITESNNYNATVASFITKDLTAVANKVSSNLILYNIEMTPKFSEWVNKPYNNLGDVDKEARHSNRSDIKLTGYTYAVKCGRRIAYKTYENKTALPTIDSNYIRNNVFDNEVNSSQIKVSNPGTYNIEYSAGTQRIVFTMPSSLTLTAAIDVGDANNNITDLFNKNIRTVTVQGADRTDTYKTNYKVYIIDFGVPASAKNTYKLTLGGGIQ